MQTHEAGVDLETLFEQAPDAVIVADTGGLVRYWNPAAERIWGHRADDVIGQRLDIIVPEQFREAHWTGFERAIADGDTKYRGQSLPTRSMRADGSEIYVELSFAILRDASGATLGATAFARDITERFERDRATRRRVRELEAELETLRADRA